MKQGMALLAMVIAGCTAIRAAGAEKNDRTTRPYVVLTGADSHVKQASFDRVQSEAQWIKVWQRHKGAAESDRYDLFYNPWDCPSSISRPAW